MSTIQPLILAAGKGTRMGNPDRPKVLTPLKDKPVLQYILNTLATTDFAPSAIVVGFKADLVMAAFGSGYTYVFQEEQLGTGHAVKVAEDQLKGTADTILLVYGDQPLVSADTMQRLVAVHKEKGAVLSLLTVHSDGQDFYNFGRIIRSETGEVQAIREYKDASTEELAITEFNAGVYCFSDAWLWDALKGLRKENIQAEYYLTDLLGFAVEAGEVVASVQPERWQEALGINTPEQLAEVERQLE